MFFRRFGGYVMATAIGVVSGVYLWMPLLEEYKRDTQGSFIPPGRQIKQPAQPSEPSQDTPKEEESKL
ncbi:uncharacterized protein VTP21DRAFT_3824 [Calcarisporiella thermophila]|uniref:uncharacterized protein n=1 Tax=Calcarisporiella thermophila TaxID=911321 RepID=UPI003743E69C